MTTMDIERKHASLKNGSALSLCDHENIGPYFHPPRIEIILFHQRIFDSRPLRVGKRKVPQLGFPAKIKSQKKI